MIMPPPGLRTDSVSRRMGFSAALTNGPVGELAVE
jgi:hypothetical protein